MMARTIAWLLVGIAVINITACSRIKSLFPDKEKDYQFTTEIPSLKLPPDLQNNAITASRSEILLSTHIPEQRYEPIENTYVSGSGSETRPLFTPVELVEYDGGATRLRIEEPIVKAWRNVGRALSRQSIEIVGRDDEQFVYIVQYDPDAKKVEDGALWDELVFLFGENPAQEQELRIRLSEKNREMTEVIVQDEKDTPVSQGAGLRLLNLLKNTINNDLKKR